MGEQPRALHGRVVAITGGAQGIGAATAAMLAAAGARVAIGDLDGRRAEKTAAEIGHGVLAIRLDVTDAAGFTGFLDRVENELGPLDVLLNNAGIMPLAGLDDEQDAATHRQLEINLRAVIHGTRQAVRRMRPRGRGHVVNIASMAGKAGFPGAATYCATKHGVVGFSESARLELRGSGVDISCVMPAVVRTELAVGLGESPAIKTVTAEQVAGAIVGTLRHPRFDVYVPRSLDWAGRITRVLPRRAGEWIVRALGGDRILTAGVGSPVRTEYEARAVESAPHVDHEA